VAAAQLTERRASNRKVAKPWFGFRCGSVSLKKMLDVILGPSSPPVVVAKDCKLDRSVLECGQTQRNDTYERRKGSRKKKSPQPTKQTHFSE